MCFFSIKIPCACLVSFFQPRVSQLLRNFSDFYGRQSVHCRADKSTPLDDILNQRSPVHTLKTPFKTTLILSSSLDFPSVLILSSFSIEILYAFPICPLCLTCGGHHILFRNIALKLSAEG